MKKEREAAEARLQAVLDAQETAAKERKQELLEKEADRKDDEKLRKEEGEATELEKEIKRTEIHICRKVDGATDPDGVPTGWFCAGGTQHGGTGSSAPHPARHHVNAKRLWCQLPTSRQLRRCHITPRQRHVPT